MFNSFRRLTAPSRNRPSVTPRRPRPRLESLEERCVPATFAPGSIQGQDGWSGGTIPIPPQVDQAVEQPTVNAHAGVGSWRVSNSTINGGGYNGNFAGWPFSPGLAVTAGQPSSGAGADRFTATFFFMSASTVADGSNIEVDLGSSAGDDRNTFLAITNDTDGDGGLQLRASEPDGVTGDFKPTQIIATGLSRTAWHRIDLVANFFDGDGNDTFQVTLDGVVLTNPLTGGTTFGTFEGFRNGSMLPYVLSNRLFWRSGVAPSSFDASFVDNAALGFYFDDVSYSASNQANPTVQLASYAASFEPTNAMVDVAVTKTNGVAGVVAGQTLTYTLVVSNSGPDAATSVAFTDLFPATLTGVTWTSAAAGGATGNTPSGSGNINDSLDLPVGSTVTYVVTATVDPAATGTLSNTATASVTVPSGTTDLNPANNSATDSDPILPPLVRLYAVGAGAGGQGHVKAFNAAGAEAASFLAYPGYAGAVWVASADVNADGVTDIVTGTGQFADHVKVFSGADGSLLYSFLAFGGYTGGIDVAAGDIDNDGFADIIVGAGPGAPGGHVKVFSGATGAEIRSFFSFVGFTGGVHVGSADLDNDGFDDVLVGTANGFSHVTGFSGQTGALLASFFAFSPALPGGVDVAGGDVNGDGFAELFASTGPGTPGLVRVFNPAGAQQVELSPYGGFTGGVSVGAADLNGDGMAEITTGAGPGAGPHVKRFDGLTAAELDSFFAFSPAFLGGVDV